jgi:ABC-2 type transport system permease protein
LFRAGAAHGFAELRALYTWQTWTGGWLVRLLSQVTFFALLGQLVGSPALTRYIVVGNAVALVSVEACLVVVSMCRERMTGTLPLIVAAPSNHLPVYLGRGVHWLGTGMLSSTVALAVVPHLFHVPLPFTRLMVAIPILGVVGLSTYCYGCVLGYLALRAMRWQMPVLNLGYLVLLAVCGVNVPVGFWPWPLRVLAEVLPLTHGLAAIRAILAGQPAQAVPYLGLEALVGAGWLALAVFAGQRLVARGRIDGSLELGS